MSLKSISPDKYHEIFGILPEDAVALTGIYGIEDVDLTGLHAAVSGTYPIGKVHIQSEFATICMTFNVEARKIKNIYVRVVEPMNGIGLQLHLAQLSVAEQLGFPYIQLSARGSFPELDRFSGYIAWAKFGYVLMNYDKHRLKHFRLLHERKGRTIYKFVKGKSNNAFWRENGFCWDGFFLIRKGSESYNALDRYLLRMEAVS